MNRIFAGVFALMVAGGAFAGPINDSSKPTTRRGDAAVVSLRIPTVRAPNTLPSWNDGAARDAILEFVAQVTTPGSPSFVPVAERIAVFDNDGTLWAEQPIYFQYIYAQHRIKALAEKHPEWKHTQPFKAVLEGNLDAISASGTKGWLEILLATHAGTTTDQFTGSVSAWLNSARHPRFDRPYPELAYQPMIEVLDFLRANGFKTFIVSGGSIEFIRAFAEKTYGIPPEQIVGSTFESSYRMSKDGDAALIGESRVEFLNDGPGKPVGIQKFIGRRPIFAFGNSDGDQQMLQWTAAGSGPRFMALVHHTDADREWAYDRTSKIGRLDNALDEAAARKWLVVDMKRDWKVVFIPRSDRFRPL